MTSSPPTPPSSPVTQVLVDLSAGDPHAAAKLLPLVYEELRRLAHDRMRHEPAGLTLQPTALVHEAYLRLVGDGPVNWNGITWSPSQRSSQKNPGATIGKSVTGLASISP